MTTWFSSFASGDVFSLKLVIFRFSEPNHRIFAHLLRLVEKPRLVVQATSRQHVNRSLEYTSRSPYNLYQVLNLQKKRVNFMEIRT